MKYYIAKNHEVTDLITGKVIAKPNATHYGAFTQMVNDARIKYFPYDPILNAFKNPTEPIEVYYHDSLWLSVDHIKKTHTVPFLLKRVSAKPIITQQLSFI